MPNRIVLIDKEPWKSKGIHKYIVDNYIAYFIVLEPERIVRITAIVLGRMDQIKQLEKINL